MAIDPKKADSYLRELLQKFEKERDSLDAHTRRLILKYKESQAKGEQLTNNLEQLRNQIKQAEAQFRSLELQAADALGKASGFLEILVSMKFEDEPVAPIAPPSPPTASVDATKKRGIRAVKSDEPRAQERKAS